MTIPTGNVQGRSTSEAADRSTTSSTDISSPETPMIETSIIETHCEMTINDNATTSISNRRTFRSRLSKPLILIAGVALVAGCTSNNSTEQVSGTSGAAGTAGVVENPESAPQITADLAGITKQNVAKIAPTRLADGLVPPTNRWFTGLVYGDQPQPVFPMPLSAALTDTGFAIGLPTVRA